MKQFFTFVLCIYSVTAFSQSATSIANGNWTNPLIWNCTCIPTPGYTIVINSNVTLNTSFSVPSGSITVNAGASLVQDNSSNRDIGVSGAGSFVNNGTSNFRFFLVQGGTSSNAGSLTLSALSNFSTFTNSGTIFVDSMSNAGTFVNSTNALILADSALNVGTFTNNGHLDIAWITNTLTFTNNQSLDFYSLTNTGVLTNNDSMIADGSLLNVANFKNNAGAYFLIKKRFYNVNDVNNNAVFDNDGEVVVQDSWYNVDTVKGISGKFTVSDTTANTGFMKGSFDMCDLTPPASAPFIDLNTGTINPGITWCGLTGREDNYKDEEIRLYPNPSTDYVFVKVNKNIKAITLYNIAGVKIQNLDKPENELKNIPAGYYFVKIKFDNEKEIVKKLQIIK